MVLRDLLAWRRRRASSTAWRTWCTSSGCCDRRAEMDRHRIRQPLGPFPEELVPFEAENAAPQAFQIDRNDRGVGAFQDFHHARLEGLHLAGAGEAPFGKDADQLAVVQGLAGRPQGGDDLLRLGRVDRNRAEQFASHLIQRRCFDVRRPGDHADRPRAGEHQQDAIDPGDVVRHEQAPALARQVLAAKDPHAIDRQAQQPDQEADRRLRDQQAR